MEKFDEGVQQRIRWKPEEVSAEMQRKNDLEDRFYFTPAEFLRPGLIRSFFSRFKAIREKQTETVVVDGLEEENDDEFDDNQVAEETEQRNNLRNSMGISNEQSSPPASSRNQIKEPDQRLIFVRLKNVRHRGNVLVSNKILKYF
ncbi:unnamed protein product [Didymodactylos carnosus]|uniref:Uncharacterized protein n=1 Tax=Didymodactylos carnosus TaxID=1234261 RepID=A0A815RD69_9BILA|nr:unnamed protein product [Didymodactylos carnosus]CAF4341005.1 unnamed protein product [Didymodactylos carnosus]